MANTVKLEVVTPEKLFYRGEVNIVICNTLLGEEGFMANHAWACKLLDVGELWIQEAGQEEYKCAALAGGYIDVKESIMIYTDAAEWSADIDMDRALSQKESAKAFLEAAGKADTSDPAEIAKAKVSLAKAMTRMSVASGGSKRKHN